MIGLADLKGVFFGTRQSAKAFSFGKDQSEKRSV
jgi:hypothetical protein